MSGHSKWATTKHKKAAIDAKRGKLFAKLIKNIEIAARLGGGDPDGNPTLYDAIVKAKKASMPADNIKRAVKRGSGEEAGGANYEEIVYEGYAPAGVGLIIECLTDNRNRAAADVRSTLSKGGGSLATTGSWCRPRAWTTTTCSRSRPRPVPTTWPMTARCSPSSPSRAIWSPSARPCRTPASTTIPLISCRARRTRSS